MPAQRGHVEESSAKHKPVVVPPRKKCDAERSSSDDIGSKAVAKTPQWKVSVANGRSQRQRFAYLGISRSAVS